MQSEIKSSEKEKKNIWLAEISVSCEFSYIPASVVRPVQHPPACTSILPRPVSQPVAPSCPHRVE